MIVRIEDRMSELVNPYSINYSIEDAGGGNQTMLFYFTVPSGASGVRLEYSADGGASYTNAGTVAAGSPATWTIPTGTYVYLFVIEYTDPLTDDEVIVVEELEGITEELTAAGSPLRLTVNNNERNKLQTIVGMQAEFRFKTDSNNNLSKLLRGPYSDKRYYMTIAVNSEEHIIFRGWVSLADNSEPFMPHPNVCALVATDGLGGLKNVTLKNFEDENPVNEHRIIDFIAWCFRFTGIEQNINVVFNWREETLPDDHAFDVLFLEAKTFEKEVGESEDCYTVFTKILKHIGFIGQRLGEWWIKAIDHFDVQPDSVAVFSSLGELQEIREAATYEKNIGKDETMSWSQGGATVSFNGPVSFAREYFAHETPKEVPDNVDFERGDYRGDAAPLWKTYDLNDWTLKAGSPASPTTPDNDAFISRKFDTAGNETERYAEITFPTYPGSNSYLEHNGIYIEQGDKFDFYCDYRLGSNYSSGTVNLLLFRVRIDGDDGSVWIYSDNNNKWQLSNSAWSVNDEQLTVSFDSTAIDETEWRTFRMSDNWTGDTRFFKEAPVSGKLYITPLWGNVSALQGISLNLANFRYIYYPKINGVFTKYTGQHHKVSQTDFNNEKIDEQLYISDVPKRLLKGCLMKADGDVYVPVERMYNWAVFPGGVPADDYLNTFGRTRAFSTWNQRKLLNRVFSGTVNKIESDSLDGLGRCDIPTVFHTYNLTDIDEHTADRKFVCLGFDMDLFLCEWRPTLVEVIDTARGKTYNDTHEFKYITER